jgi:hypothetical protein
MSHRVELELDVGSVLGRATGTLYHATGRQIRSLLITFEAQL